ncbi:hypothetical protein ACE6H2_026991 [Prunus campanulata]
MAILDDFNNGDTSGDAMFLFKKLWLQQSHGHVCSNKRGLGIIERELQSLNKPFVKTIQLEEGDIIDCFDIYTQPAFDNPLLKNHKIQPAFDNPLLKNHKIQLRPTSFPAQMKNSAPVTDPISETWSKREACPDGTVPIHRTTKDDLVRAKNLAHQMFRNTGNTNPLPWNIHVSPSINGDQLPRLYTCWTVNNGKIGCFNLLCAAFVQIDRTLTLKMPLSPVSTIGGPSYDMKFTIYQGSLEDEENLMAAVKQVDVVICAVSSKQVLLQKLLVQVIKKSGCIKRFIPSEFGLDPDKTRISDMDYNFYKQKSEIRRFVEAHGIPYTYISCNFYVSCLLPQLVRPQGPSEGQGVFVKESDVAEFTIRTLDDPQTLNKVLYLRPPGNVYSMNELVELWESKIGKKREKIFVSEQELLKKFKETPYPDNMEMIFIYSAFIKGDQTYFDIESSGGLDDTKLYPEQNFTAISEYLDTLL